MPTPLYGLILAGGTGSRLWPRSRTRHPKQFLDLMGDQTMLQQAQSRLVPLIQPQNTFIATGSQYIETVSRQLPQLPQENIIGEPEGRGTAAAIGLTAFHIAARSRGAIMAVLTADHLIRDIEAFRRSLEAAGHIAEEGWLVTLGIRPDYAETGYGYIQRGEFLGTVGEFEGYQVRRFVEKPDFDRATQFVESGEYEWNSGMFIWRVDRILDEMKRFLPDLYNGLARIAATIGTDDYSQALQEIFPTLPNVTVDYGIMEKADKVAMLPIEIGWNDVGSWSSVYDVLPKDGKNNAVVGSHISPNTRNSLIVSSNRLVATIGLEDVVIVDTEDVLLVCRRDQAQDVRMLVDMLKQNGEAGYLDGAQNIQPLDHAEVERLFEAASPLEKVLISLLLHGGFWPSHIVVLEADDIDLIGGWVNTPEGKRPLPDVTRSYLYAWMREEDTLKFAFRSYWETSDAIKAALEDLGARVGLSLSVDRLYETLARALFQASQEGQVMRTVLGEETDLVRVPLHALFPFSMPDFTDNESNALGERAHRVMNRAAEQI